MAAKGGNQKSRKANSMLTKTGKTRLGPLTIAQLTDMLEKASRGVIKAKIANKIRIMKLRKGYVAPAVVEEVVVVEEVIEVVAY
jgi:hypothetical protein